MSFYSANPRQATHAVKRTDKSNQLIITITSDLFNHRSDIMLVEHRTHTIAASHVFEPLADFAYVQGASHV
jgi:hypothetical protein